MSDLAADWGDDPTVKGVDVLGHRGSLGHTDTAIAIAWVEEPCPYQYAVAGAGVDEPELLRIARSLQVEGKS